MTSEWKYFIDSYKKSRTGLLGLAIMTLMVITAIFAKYIAPYGYDYLNIGARFLPPSWEHLFGTDQLGSDTFSRVVYASQVDLQLGVIIVAIDSVIGTLVGLFAGYYRRIDNILMRVTDLFFSIPSLVLAMAIAAALGPSIQNVMIAAAVSLWPGYARIIRSKTLGERQKEYVDSAVAVGQTNFYIIFREILPNVASILIIYAALEMADALLIAAALSFIGLGAHAPTPEWGSMAHAGQPYLTTYWWIAVFPGVALAITVLGFMLIGDTLRDTLDPRMRV